MTSYNNRPLYAYTNYLYRKYTCFFQGEQVMEIDQIKVLLVDDEPEFLEQAEIFLKKEDNRFVITSANTVEKALNIIENEKIDAVVSDYRMPDNDGIEFLKIIRKEKESDIPFILFTGKGWEEVAMNALNLGANKYIWKSEEPSLYEREEEPESQYSLLADEIINEVKKFKERENWKLAQRTMEEANVGIFWVDPEGKILYSNKAVTDMLGYDKSEILDMHVWDIDPHLEKEKREEIWNKIKEEGVRTVESEQETKDGSKISVEITTHYVKHEDREIEFAFVRDIEY